MPDHPDDVARAAAMAARMQWPPNPRGGWSLVAASTGDGEGGVEVGWQDTSFNLGELQRWPLATSSTQKLSTGDEVAVLIGKTMRRVQVGRLPGSSAAGGGGFPIIGHDAFGLRYGLELTTSTGGLPGLTISARSTLSTSTGDGIKELLIGSSMFSQYTRNIQAGSARVMEYAASLSSAAAAWGMQVLGSTGAALAAVLLQSPTTGTGGISAFTFGAQAVLLSVASSLSSGGLTINSLSTAVPTGPNRVYRVGNVVHITT